MTSLRFFVFGGVILILTALLQLFVRPRKAGEKGPQRYINRATVWATFCVLVGLLAIGIGAGLVPLANLGL